MRKKPVSSEAQSELPKYQIQDLLYLMARLRHPEHGCPWDLQQNYETIVKHTLEEAYEVADAINRDDKQDLKDELGDLLFQVVFYAQLGQEDTVFDFDDVVDGIVNKLIRRHPHVFPNGELRAYFPEGTKFSDEQIKEQWEAIKQQERQLKLQLSQDSADKVSKFTSLLDGIPDNLPALNKAEKLQKRASQHGFDWQEIEPVFDKIQEELLELKSVLKQASSSEFSAEFIQHRLQDELGDVLFSCVNLARFIKVSPDQALRSTNNKFVHRFKYIEKHLMNSGSTVDEVPLEELGRLWELAKTAL